MIAAAFLLGSMPVAASAHAVGPSGGVDLEFLLVAVAVIVLGLRLRASKDVRPAAGYVAVAIGVALLGAALIVPRIGPARPNVSVTIVSPQPGASVPSGEPLTIETTVTGAQIAASAQDTKSGHLHVYVDGQLQQMPYSTSTEIKLKPGDHAITVEYVDASHIAFQPPIDATVNVTAEES
jgi:hypothetical protein